MNKYAILTFQVCFGLTPKSHRNLAWNGGMKNLVNHIEQKDGLTYLEAPISHQVRRNSELIE